MSLLDSSLGQGHCVVFLCKTLYSQWASFQQCAQMGTNKLNAGWEPCDGLASHPVQSKLLLVDSCIIVKTKQKKIMELVSNII